MVPDRPNPAQPSPPPGHERREVRYSGRVQGVGFRYTTRGIAAGRPVAGYVRNLPDGTVELVVEGATGALDQFLAAVTNELGRYIEHQEVTRGPATGELTRFEIAF
jgi:acylphosphatase